LPHRESGEEPPTFPQNYKEVYSDAGKSKCSSALQFYEADADADACISFLTYIGAPVSIKRDTIMHALIHNSNARDTLADFELVPHFYSGLLPEVADFPKNFEEFVDEEKWPADKITKLLKFYREEPISSDLKDLRPQLLEYIGAPVTILRDTLLHARELNSFARETKGDFKVVPHPTLGIVPKIPFPKNWNQVMSGDFTIAQIKDLLKFYYQNVTENASPSELQIQLLDYIGCPVVAQESEIEKKAALFFDNQDAAYNPVLLDHEHYSDNLERQILLPTVPF